MSLLHSGDAMVVVYKAVYIYGRSHQSNLSLSVSFHLEGVRPKVDVLTSPGSRGRIAEARRSSRQPRPSHEPNSTPQVRTSSQYGRRLLDELGGARVSTVDLTQFEYHYRLLAAKQSA